MFPFPAEPGKTLMPAKPLATAIVVILLMGGCASQETTSTGFIQSQTKAPINLTAAQNDSNEYTFKTSKESISSYHSFMIDEVTFRPGPKMPLETTDEIRADLKQTYTDALREAFGLRLKYVQQPGPGTLRVKAAITGYERANVALNIVTSALIGPVTAGGAASEAIALDSLTNVPILALATHSNGTPLMGGPVGYFTQHGHARRALARHAEALADLLAPAEQR